VALVDPQRPAETEVEVEGGETLELWVDEDPSRQPPRRLVYHRYDKSLRAYHDHTPAPSDPEGRSFFIGTHVPQREGNAVKFFLSVQNAAADQFSPRPAEVWVQIKPVVPAGHPGSDAIYSFYDAVYEPDYPVPMLSFTAPNWPAEAATALVRFCGKLQKTPPDVQVSVAEFPREKARIDQRLGGEFTLETEPPPKPGDPYRVIFTEKQPVDRGIYALKVEMLPAAAKTIHHYSPKTGTVRHTFLYPDATAADVAACQLLLTTSEKLVDGAIALPEPLEVTLTPD
jgi:hypothetical protein